jgi:hypothetical protein
LKRIYERGFIQKTAKMELMIRGGSARKLGEDLSVKKGSDYRFKVKNVDANSLTVMILPLKTEESISLTVMGLDSYNKIAKIKGFLWSNIKGLKKINDREFARDTARMELMIDEGSARKLAEVLSMKKGPDYRFEVKNLAVGALTVMMQSLEVDDSPASAEGKGVEPALPVSEDVKTHESEKPKIPVEVKKPEPAGAFQKKVQTIEPKNVKAPVEVKKFNPIAATQEKSKPPEFEKSKHYILVKVDLMNVHEFPDSGFKKLGRAKRDEKYLLLATVHPKPGSTWYEIDYKGKRAFVIHDMVDVINGE